MAPKVEKVAAKVSKPHTIYYVDSETEVKKDGTPKKIRVPGVTTITGVLNKPALVKWANEMGLKGIDTTKYVDETAKIGTLSHYFVECELMSQITGQKIKPDLSTYTEDQIDAGQNGAIRFFDWQERLGFNPIASEMKLVSKKFMFGGTIDAYGTIHNGKKILMDLKTSKGIFPEMKTQVAGGYALLLEENNYEVDEIHIIRVGRSEEEGFDDCYITPYEVVNHRRRFILCRELYDLNKICDPWTKK